MSFVSRSAQSGHFLQEESVRSATILQCWWRRKVMGSRGEEEAESLGTAVSEVVGTSAAIWMM